MLIVQKSADVADRREVEAWSKRERVECEIDPHSAIERACTAGARLVVLDYDAWLPDTMRELCGIAHPRCATLPVLIRGTMCHAFAGELTALASLPFSVDVSLRSFEELGPRLNAALPRGPQSATMPVLRELGARLTREQLHLFAGMLSMGTRRPPVRVVANALGMSVRKFQAERVAAGIPDYPTARAAIFGLHVVHWIRVLCWTNETVADVGRFATSDKLNEYLSTHCGVNCGNIREGALSNDLQQVARWFAVTDAA